MSGSGSWGIYETLYLARYNDLKTGKKLDRPVVYIIDVNHGKDKLEAPVVTKRVTNDGNLRLDWKPVEGATGYWVIKRERRSSGSADGEFNLASRYHYSFIGAGTETSFLSDKQSREHLIQKTIQQMISWIHKKPPMHLLWNKSIKPLWTMIFS